MKRGKKKDRNAAVGPMTPFQRVQAPEGSEEIGIVAAFENNRYNVILKKTLSQGYSVQDENGNAVPMEVMEMMIYRVDKKKKEIPWEEKQNIKNEIMGPMSDAVEIFPSEMRRQHSIRDYCTHLWVFPPGIPVMVGYFPKSMEQAMSEPTLDDMHVDENDLKVFLVEDDDVQQVFGDEDEAKSSYEEAGNDFPGGIVIQLSEAPLEGDGSVWTDLAKAKIARVLQVSDAIDRENGDAFDSNALTVNTNGPETDQDELEDEYGVVDESPSGDEENVMAPEYMQMGVEQMQQNRRATLGKSIEKFAGLIEERKLAAAEAKKSEAEEAKEEEEAAAELDAMRQEMLGSKKKNG